MVVAQGSKKSYLWYGFTITKERLQMKYKEIPFYARILFVIGIGVALSVALDNIAVGIGVATVFLAALVVRKNNFTGETEKNDDK